MKNIFKWYLGNLVILTLIFSLNGTNSQASCYTMPTCDEMGYTSSNSCRTGISELKCMFDTSKRKCFVNDNSGIPSYAYCSNLGYTNTSCPDGLTALRCPYDSTKVQCVESCTYQNYPINSSNDNVLGKVSCCRIKSSSASTTSYCRYDYCYPHAEMILKNRDGVLAGICLPKLKSCDEASVGDYFVYRDDLKRFGCIPKYYMTDILSLNLGPNQDIMKVHGVVADTTNKLIISPFYKRLQMDIYSPVPGLVQYGQYIDSAQAVNDMDGRQNTLKILSTGSSSPAAQYCNNKTDGNKNWFIPSLGQFNAIMTNLPTINLSLSRVYEQYLAGIPTSGQAVGAIEGYPHWTSTQIYDNGNSGFMQSDTSNYFPYTGNNSSDVRCVFSYGENSERDRSYDPYDGIYKCIDGPLHVGDVYWQELDGWGNPIDYCGTPYNSATVLGVVIDAEKKIVLSVTPQRAYWGSHRADTGATNRTSDTNALQDMNGESNTALIVESNLQDGFSGSAAELCQSKTDGGKNWFLPSAGQMKNLCLNSIDGQKINTMLATPLDNDFIWSSTEENMVAAWYLETTMGTCRWRDYGKEDHQFNVYCAFSF